jgi:hypothetical protein
MVRFSADILNVAGRIKIEQILAGKAISLDICSNLYQNCKSNLQLGETFWTSEGRVK